MTINLNFRKHFKTRVSYSDNISKVVIFVHNISNFNHAELTEVGMTPSDL